MLKYDHLDTTTGPLLMTTSDSQSVRKTRWYSPTVGKFLFAISALQVVLYLSQRLQWFAFNQLKGHTVVITVTATAIGLLLIAGVVVLGRKAQFTLATLLLMAPVMAIPCIWLVREMSQAQRPAQIVAGCEPYRLNYNTPSPDSAVRRWFAPIFGKDLFVEVSELLTDQADVADLQKVLKGCSISHNAESWRRRAPRNGKPRPCSS